MSAHSRTIRASRNGHPVRVLVEELVVTGKASTAVAVYGDAEGVFRQVAAGRDRGRRISGQELYDIASLTKPFMATLALLLARLELMTLKEQVGDVFADASRDLRKLPLADLLRHRGGFQPWAPLYAICKSLPEVDRYLTTGPCRGALRDTYSDLGYILWARCAEVRTGVSLRELTGRYLVSGGLPVAGDGEFSSGNATRCLLDGSREAELAQAQGVSLSPHPAPLRGKVQDGNANFLGGLAGHAGLFASAWSLWRLGALWLSPEGLLDREATQEALGGEEQHALGWWRGRNDSSARGVLSQESFGHPGFTGCSLWVDPVRGVVLVLAAHRTSLDVDMTPWRRRFHELALSDLGC